MSTAVIYARFSCSKQREASIDDQVRVCTEYCRREGLDVVGCYCDYAVSGRTDDRPQFQLMVERAGESDVVVVYMMDRFSRDEYDAPLYKKRLREHGVRVVSATESIPDTPEAVLIEKIYEGLAAVESAHIAERTRRGMEGNALKCKHNGVTVFGYRFAADGGYEVDDAQAELVRLAFAMRLEGETEHAIAGELARRGAVTSTGRAASPSFVHTMLKNEKYAGVYSWGGVRVEGGMPRIVDDATFAAVQRAPHAKNRKLENWGEFPLSGRAICGACGRGMCGVSGRGRKGVKYEYYRCSARCGAQPVRSDALERAVALVVRSILENRGTALAVAHAVESHYGADDVSARIEDAKRRRDACEREVRNYVDALGKGVDAELLTPRIEDAKRRMGAAIADLAVLEHAPRFSVDDFADFLQFSATLDDTSLVDALVYQVMVRGDDVVITLNYDVDGASARAVVGKKELEPPADELVRVNWSWLPSRNGSRIVAVGYSPKLGVLVRGPLRAA